MSNYLFGLYILIIVVILLLLLLHFKYYYYISVTIIFFTTSNCKQCEFIGFNSILRTEKLNQIKLISFEDPLIH